MITLSQARRLLTQLSRESFYVFCQQRYPQYYKPDRIYLRVLCNTLQDFYENKLLDSNGKPYTKLIINMPPRHYKTMTAINFSQWYLGKERKKAILSIAYNETLSGRFAKYVRDGIAEEPKDPRKKVYVDYFPGTQIKKGDSSYFQWSLEGSHFSFMAASPGSSLTGFGATGFGFIDDLIKNAYEAYNERILGEHFDWYTDTYLSRLEEGAKEIIIMTRWSKNDLCGRLLKLEPEKWYVLSFPAHNPEYAKIWKEQRKGMSEADAQMLCPEVLSASTYEDRKTKTSPIIFEANYNQKLLDETDLLYSRGFKTYDVLPAQFEKVVSYTDTADEGKDSLASGLFGIKDNKGYLLDLVFSDAHMETTEEQGAQMHCQKINGKFPDKADIESNNGGRGWGRNVENKCRQYGNNFTVFEAIPQSKNKEARIRSNATEVMNTILMPTGWERRWPLFANQLMSMSTKTKWLHDDAADMLTGFYEKNMIVNSFAMY